MNSILNNNYIFVKDSNLIDEYLQKHREQQKLDKPFLMTFKEFDKLCAKLQTQQRFMDVHKVIATYRGIGIMIYEIVDKEHCNICLHKDVEYTSYYKICDMHFKILEATDKFCLTR